MSAETIVHNFARVFQLVALSPCSWPFIFLLPIWVALTFFVRRPPGARVLRYGRWAFITTTVAVLGVILFSHVSYLNANTFTNGYATDYADTSWYFSNGHELYLSSHATFRYSLCYGPVGYILVAVFQHLLGPSPLSSNLPIFGSWLGGFVFLYLALRVRQKWETALAVTTLGMALLPHLQEFQFWPRPDFPLFFLVFLALWIVAKNLRISWIALGLIIGIAVGIKLHGFAYFLPIIGLLLQKRPGFVLISTSFILAVLVSLLPFFLLHQVSFLNYLHVIQINAHHEIDVGLAYEIFEILVILSIMAFAPFIIYRVDSERTWLILTKNGPFLIGLIVGLVIILYPAVREGAGDHHLIPFVGLALFLGSSIYADFSTHEPSSRDLSPTGSSLFFSQCCVIYLYALFFNLSFLSHLPQERHAAQTCYAAVDQVIQNYGDVIILYAPGANVPKSIGCIESYAYSSHLVFKGFPIGIDSAGLMDFSEAHVPEPTPDEVVREVENQYHRSVIWISPRGDKPFTEQTYYPPWGPDFSSSFVDNFHRQFRLLGHTDYLDIYGKAP